MEDKTSFLILPGKKHGNYEYPDLDVSMYRTGYNTGIVTLDKRINIAKEENGHSYIRDIVWEEALKLNLVLGNDGTPSLRQFLDLKELLEKGINQEEKVLYANGKEIDDRKTLQAVYNEIFKTREPFRGEFLDAQFKFNSGILYLNQDHRIINDLLVPQYSQPVLENSLMEICYVNLKRCNEQGLPIKRGKNIYYRPPKDGDVYAAFDDVMQAIRRDINDKKKEIETAIAFAQYGEKEESILNKINPIGGEGRWAPVRRAIEDIAENPPLKKETLEEIKGKYKKP